MSDALSDPADAKAALRKDAARTRAALAAGDPDAADRLAAQAGIIAALAGEGQDHPGIVAAYLPIRSELSPLPLVVALVAAGINTAMPVTPEPGRPLVFRSWAPGDDLADGPYKTKQPLPAPAAIPTVVLAPMLAFDDEGWRLGYGGGFYDRTLALPAPGTGSARLALPMTASMSMMCRPALMTCGWTRC